MTQRARKLFRTTPLSRVLYISPSAGRGEKKALLIQLFDLRKTSTAEWQSATGSIRVGVKQLHVMKRRVRREVFTEARSDEGEGRCHGFVEEPRKGHVERDSGNS